MNNNIFTLRNLVFGLGIFMTSMEASAQIDVTAPLERAVYQREISGSADVTVSGSYAIPVDKIEVRATPVVQSQGTALNWTTLQDKPAGGVFSGILRLSGGWYKVEVRGIKNGIAVGNTDEIARLGVGEVFIIAGQSNAQGINYSSPPAKDDRVNYVNYNNEDRNDFMDLPAPLFSQLGSSTHTMGLRGHGTWCWGILGDLLTQKLNVPVMFVNTGWDSTGLLNWVKSSRDEATYDVFSGLLLFRRQMPYANLRLSVQHYAKQYGARAVLWMQGESDNLPLRTSQEDYRAGLKSLISKLSSDANVRVPWVIARTSRTAVNNISYVSPAIVGAQTAVINDLPGVAYPGPETDNLYPERNGDGTHFQGIEGVTILANAWNNALNINFFSTVNPVSVSQEPKIASRCTDNSRSLELSLPEGYLNYKWTVEVNGTISEPTGRSIVATEPGRYTAKVLDNNGNALRTQTMVIQTPIKPARPAIRESGARQACTDSVFTFSVGAGNDLYSWYREGTPNSLVSGTSLSVTQGGNYFVRSQNVFGCLSDNSEVSSLTIRPRIPTPVIVRTGPFTVEATLDQTGLDEQYDWRVDQQLLTTPAGNVVRTVREGTYTSRAKLSFILGSNLLTCYSPFSNTLQITHDDNTDIVIFPNPGAKGDVYAESREDIVNATITVYDLYGRVMVVQTQDMKSRVKVQVKNLSSGKYIVRILGAGVDVRKQLVVL